MITSRRHNSVGTAIKNVKTRSIYARYMHYTMYGAMMTIASEIFDGQPSDQCLSFKSFISRMYNNVHHFVRDNLPGGFNAALRSDQRTDTHEVMGEPRLDFGVFL